MSSKTYMAKPGEVTALWHLVDAEDRVLGRLASRIATILQGKHRPTYTPHVDTGDFVVIINAEKIALTGKKMDTMYHRRFTRHPGSYREIPISKILAEHPDRVITQAVKRMLPRTKLGVKMLKKLKVYGGPTHPHEAQNPQPLEL